MKKLLLVFFIFLFSIIGISQPYTFTSINFSGWPPKDWTSSATWIISGGNPGYNYPQTTDDIVVINGLLLLNVDNLTVASITINNNITDQFGSLDVQSNTISATGDLKLLGHSVGNGSLSVSTGNINTGGAFIFNKGSLSLAGCTLNIGDYYSQAEGTMTTSATVNINISTGGPRNDDTNPSLFFGLNAIVTLNSSNVEIDLQNLNTGTAPEIFANDFTVNGAGGTITLEINNNSNISNDICYITSDAAFKTLDLNLNNDIASGNSIECSTINAGVTFEVEDLFLSNSLMYTVPTTHFTILNSLSLNPTSALTVNGNFTSSAPNDLSVDGILTVNGDMSITSNLGGDGLVQAVTYSLGANTIYGFQPVDDHKAAAQTWGGNNSDDWFAPNNWKGGGTPTANKAVVIDDVDPPTNMPKIAQAGGAAKSIDIDGPNAKLIIDGNNSSLTIETYLTIDGWGNRTN